MKCKICNGQFEGHKNRKYCSNRCSNRAQVVQLRQKETTSKHHFLTRVYRNMLSRIKGVVKHKAHLYDGLTILSRDQFLEFSKSDPEFNRLFDAWQESGRDQKLVPSPDRMDSSKGYELWNIEWTTNSENSRRGALSYWHGCS